MNELLFAYGAAFVLSFYLVIKSADYGITFATRLARQFGISEFAISFLLIGLVTALPETVISLSAGAQGKPDIAIISLLASNVVDLTFLFGVVALFASGLHISAPILKREMLYLVLLALPLALGFDGHISGSEGVALFIAGMVFLISIASEHKVFRARVPKQDLPVVVRTIVLLIISLLIMVVAASFTVDFLSILAKEFGVNATLIAVFVIGIGTCLPELLFTIRSLQQHKYEMALGNVLGVVIIDATVMLGFVAMLFPLHADALLVRVNGLFVVVGGLALLYFLKVRQQLRRWEAIMLLCIYAIYTAVQFLIA